MKPVDDNNLFLTCNSCFTHQLGKEVKNGKIKSIRINKIANEIYEHDWRIIVKAEKAYLSKYPQCHHPWSNDDNDNKKCKKMD